LLQNNYRTKFNLQQLFLKGEKISGNKNKGLWTKKTVEGGKRQRNPQSLFAAEAAPTTRGQMTEDRRQTNRIPQLLSPIFSKK